MSVTFASVVPVAVMLEPLAAPVVNPAVNAVPENVPSAALALFAVVAAAAVMPFVKLAQAAAT